MKYSQLAKKYIEKLYDGTCTIMEYSPQQGLLNNTTETVIGEGIPCRLSYKLVKNAEQTETVAIAEQKIQLFLSPAIPVKDGSKIIVTQEGKTQAFTGAGKPAVYGSHQAILLEVERKYP